MRAQLCSLPLGLLAIEEALEDPNNLGKSGKVLGEVLDNELRGLAELGVKVLAVRAGSHGGAEDRLDKEAVVRLQGIGVGSTE